MSFNRRSFLKSTVVAGTAAAMPAISYARIAGANEKIRWGVIGLNGRGQKHIAGLKANGVELKDNHSLTLGVEVKMNVDTEQVTNNEKANQKMTREYRNGSKSQIYTRKWLPN